MAGIYIGSFARITVSWYATYAVKEVFIYGLCEWVCISEMKDSAVMGMSLLFADTSFFMFIVRA